MKNNGRKELLQFCANKNSILAVSLLISIIYSLSVIHFEIQNWPITPKLFKDKTYIDAISSIFSNSCECKSMFTIGYCKNWNTNHKSYIRNWKEISTNLNKLHSGKYFAAHELYTRISRYLSPTNKIVENETSIKGNSSLNRKSAEVENMFAKFEPQELPYVPCKQHTYQTEEAKNCVKRFEQLTGRPLKIAFVGDSTIRVFMETFVKDFNRAFDFQFLGSDSKFNISENFLDNKAKFNIPLGGNGLQLRFYWAPFLHRVTTPNSPHYQGAKDIIKSWVEKPKESDLPDIVYLSFGMWHAVYIEQSDSIGFHASSLSEMSQLLRDLARITKVLFHITPPVKHWLLNERKQDPMSVLDFINQIKFWHFSGTDILMWDSLYPIALREIKECESFVKLKRILNISVPSKMGCFDFMHIGAQSRRTGNNLVWNLICNKIMKLENESCCS